MGARLKVSILSRPEGRLQQPAEDVKVPLDALFQSSAAPKDGCNELAHVNALSLEMFQSSAAPKDGCN